MRKLTPQLIPLLGLMLSISASSASAIYNVKDYGAVGDGITIDSTAINQAIQAAAEAGGGTVYLPAGTYASYTIRLQSRITLHLESGATLLAAYPAEDGSAGYDPAEPNPWGDELKYQDFGHSHWRNSLITGEDLVDVSITGAGKIDGRALVGGHPVLLPGEVMPEHLSGKNRYRGYQPGSADKAIALKNCRNVLLRDVSMFRCGHFALLATGVDNLTIENLKVDTNRDGFDIDACRNVRVTDCFVNTPNDDAIVLKSSYALGEARATENVSIIGCQVTGYVIGSLLDGTFDRSIEKAPDQDGPTGRIKFGTESNGGFKNVTIGNCIFDRSRGLALEIVDGGVLEDVVISNLVMRDIVNSPIFIRLGDRRRGPEGTSVGAIRRVSIDNIVASGVDSRYATQIVGLPGHPIQNIRLSNLHIQYRGGVSMQDVADQPETLVNNFFLRGDEPGIKGPRDPFAVPQRTSAYPEPSMFGLLPAYGIYARHVEGLEICDVRLELIEEDNRSVVTLDSVNDIQVDRFRAPVSEGSTLIELRNVRDIELQNVNHLDHLQIDTADQKSIL